MAFNLPPTTVMQGAGVPPEIHDPDLLAYETHRLHRDHSRLAPAPIPNCTRVRGSRIPPSCLRVSTMARQALMISTQLSFMAVSTCSTHQGDLVLDTFHIGGVV